MSITAYTYKLIQQLKMRETTGLLLFLSLAFQVNSGSLHSMPLFNNKKILSLLANRENIFSLTLRKSKNIDS